MAAKEAAIKPGQSPFIFLNRHRNRDWGDLSQEDIKANTQALNHGERLLSSYKTATGKTVWIITEADRSSTCILLPSEY